MNLKTRLVKLEGIKKKSGKFEPIQWCVIGRLSEGGTANCPELAKIGCYETERITWRKGEPDLRETGHELDKYYL